MKYFLPIIFFLFCSAKLYAQAETSAYVQADTMRRHIPEGLDEHVVLMKIVITGNKQTRERIVLREMNVKDGDLVRRDSLEYIMNLNKIRIINLELFNEVGMRLEKTTNAGVIWHITVKERWYIFPEISLKLADRNFNVWWYEQNHDIKRAVIGVALSHFNFRGNHEKLSLSAQVGYTQKFGINYQRPFIDKKQKHGIGISVYDSRNRETYIRTDSNKWEFARSSDRDVLHIFETNLSYTYRPAYATRHLAQLSYRFYEIDDSLRDLNPNYFADGSSRADYLEVFFRIDINKVDNWNYPLRGFKFIGSFTNRIGFSGLGWQSFANVETGYFNNPFGKVFWDVIFRGRLMLPERPPYAFLGGMGGQNDYMRGYEYYVIDGPQYGLFRFDFKYEALNYTIKGIPIRVLSVIPIRLYPKLFADIGAVRNPNPLNSKLNNRLLYSGGVGIDLVTAYQLKLRFEYAFNHLGEKGLFLHSNSE
ncbi:MAG TPA: POTRA domain-containing protein [Flavipsychrobacter sp.]|nr:POTRA domain-containing protein [Flavipsychrobacter sp.]